MLRSSVTLLSVAALALLGGCTITTYNSSNPPPKRRAAQAQPASQTGKPNFRHPASASVHPKSGSTTPVSNTAQGDVAPRITSPIIFGNGTGGAFTGKAYVIPDSSTKLPDTTTMIPFATLFTDSFDIKPQEFAGGFPGAMVQEDWFAIRYDGVMTAAKDSRMQFKVISDDGAVLYIDGQKVVDNDGRHTVRTATGEATLKAGPHLVRLDYFQALKGTVALQVYIVEGGKDRLLVGTK